MKAARRGFTRLLVCALCALVILSPNTCLGQEEGSAEYIGVGDAVPSEDAAPEENGSILTEILLYLPNRVLDLFDIVRARVRVGPGVAVGVRVTEVAQLNLGSYGSVYAGLPGPRQRVVPRAPVGVEAYTGVALSVLEAKISGGLGPHYSPTEVGAGAHLILVGVDVGIDPVELADFFAGFALVDIRDDDL